MLFTPTQIAGVFLVDVEPLTDERGFFARSWCRDEFADHGLDASLAQCNISFNQRRGTLRGLHYQAQPHAEVKLVRCTRGAVFDVVVDLRQDSPTFRHWLGIELTEDNHRAVFIPADLAHGFQTLLDLSEVFYQMSAPYHANSARGVRWNDPSFGIAWPILSPVLSLRDQHYPDFCP